MMKYREKLRRAISESRSSLCVGLDPHSHLLPKHLTDEFPDLNERITFFLKKVIAATTAYTAAYKPNLAFFEALGSGGLKIFDEIIQRIPEGKVIIADAKRGDIGSTASNYRKAFFDHWNVDAITLNPLMGFETLEPYFNYSSKAVYVLTLTSNAGASDFLARPFAEFNTMAEFIASNLQKIQSESSAQLGMVVGATRPSQLAPVLKHHPTAPLLIPGIGKQGGKVEDLVTALKNHEGIPLISSSRSILFAGEDSENWDQIVAEKAKQYQEQLKPITEKYV